MTMEQQTFYGPITVRDIAEALVAEFNHGDMRAQVVGSGDQLLVQIASVPRPASGGRTALSVQLAQVEDGVLVQLGQQEWLSVAASLGKTAFHALRNPFLLLGRLDDLASDLNALQLKERVWETVERAADALGASHDLSERLRRLVCEYCMTPNPVGEPHCMACGAPLGAVQPTPCAECGYVMRPDETICPNCGARRP
jgi:hypothetical protein